LAAASGGGAAGAAAAGAQQQQQQQEQFLAALAGALANAQQQQPQQHQQHQPHPHHRSSAAAAAARLPPPEPLPPWAARLQRWWELPPAAAASADNPSAPAVVPRAEAPAALKAVAAALGGGAVVTTPGVVREEQQQQQAALSFSLTATGVATDHTTSSPSTLCYAPRDVDGLLRAWLARAAGPRAGISPLMALQRAYLAAAASPASPLLLLLRRRLAARAADELGRDEDDIYFAGGRTHAEIMEAMAAGQLSPAFLEDMIAASLEGGGGTGAGGGGDSAPAATGEQQRAASAWWRLLSDAVAAAGKHPLTGTLPELDACLSRIDACTRPAALDAALAAALAAEAAGAFSPTAAALPGAGLAFQRRAVLGPLLALSPYVDMTLALRTGAISSPASAVFSQIRGYPNMPAEAAAARRLMQSVLDRTHEAAHQVLLRVAQRVKLPSGASGAGGGGGAASSASSVPAGREAVVAWLAAAAASNEDRARVGERAALRTLGLSCDDGFALSLTSVALRFCRPFVRGYLSLSGGGAGMGGGDAAGEAAARQRWGDLFSRHLSPDYYSSPVGKRRLGPRHGLEPTLAGGRGVLAEDAEEEALGAAGATRGFLAPLEESGGGASAGGGAASSSSSAPPSFIADTFFLAQRYLHVFLVPAVNRYGRFIEALYQSSKRKASAGGGGSGTGGGGGGGGEGGDSDSDGGSDMGDAPNASASHAPSRLEVTLAGDCCASQLLDPALVADAVQFCALQAQWLAWLLSEVERHEAAAEAAAAAAGGAAATTPPPPSSTSLPFSDKPFARIPEYVVDDLAAWLAFVVRSGQAEQLAANGDVGGLMRCLVSLLRHHPRHVRSPIVVTKVVNLLLAMLSPQLAEAQAAEGAWGKGAASLGRSNLRPGEAALVAAVLSSPAARGDLPPALMRVYGQADFVVGLDVDKDSFDKFNMRHAVDLILLELLRDEACAAGIRRLASAEADALAAAAASGGGGGGGGSGDFADFVSAVLNDLMYLLKDALDRLADIHAIEASKRDATAWAALTDKQRADKESFYRGQQSAARGFLALARTTLRLLHALSADPVVALVFLQQPLLGRAAYACLHFAELLSGPRCQELKVERALEMYGFDRAQLLTDVCVFTAQLARHAPFVRALAGEDDFDPRRLSLAVDLLNAGHQYGAADAMKAVVKAASAARAGGQAVGVGGGEAAEGGGSKAEAAEGGGDGNGAADTAALDALAAEWEAALTAGASAASLPAEPGPELDAAYEAAMRAAGCESGAVGTFSATAAAAGGGGGDGAAAGGGAPPSSTAVGASYNRAFLQMAEDEAAGGAGAAGGAAKMKRVARELRDLRGRTALPVSAAAAIVLRHDEERPDLLRALISGPEGSPYEHGLFTFDLLLPAGYPRVPPLMVLETTGQGRARFNPNLYADGKVCLSLLGTWHGGSATEKWSPDSSSLFQVLMSVQSLIFVPDPYFNEPQVDLMRGSAEGERASRRYNAEVRLAVVRFAMLAQLRAPPPGFGDAVRAHFGALRRALVRRQAWWVRECAESAPALLGRMQQATAELVAELAKL
jgi:ubiquitin-protein ligase